MDPTTTAIHTQDQLRQALKDNPDKHAAHVFSFNKHAIASAMLAAGVAEVVVTYSGAGDEGRHDDTILQPDTVTDASATVECAAMRYRWDPETSLGGTELVFEVMNLTNAVGQLCDDAIDLTGHSGFEDGNGGEGTFSIVAQTAEVKLEHRDHYIESDESVHAL